MLHGLMPLSTLKKYMTDFNLMKHLSPHVLRDVKQVIQR